MGGVANDDVENVIFYLQYRGQTRCQRMRKHCERNSLSSSSRWNQCHVTSARSIIGLQSRMNSWRKKNQLGFQQLESQDDQIHLDNESHFSSYSDSHHGQIANHRAREKINMSSILLLLLEEFPSIWSVKHGKCLYTSIVMMIMFMDNVWWILENDENWELAFPPLLIKGTDWYCRKCHDVIG